MSWLYSVIISGILLTTGDQEAAQIYFNEAGGKTVQAAVVAPQDEVRDRFEATYPLSANGRISVSNVNGSITVESWDRNEVKLEAVKVADSAETLSEVEIKITDRPDFLRVETDYKNLRYTGQNRRRKLEVTYKLTVPRNATLNSIETVNGSVSIKGVHGMTKASVVNGGVKVENIRGDVDLSTVNGEVVADFDNIEAGGRISLNTVNGSINATFPSDLNATLKADSLNGNITNEFGLPVKKGEYVGRNLYGKIGNGATQIKLGSVNGPLTIVRKKDGKSVSPTVDLSGTAASSERVAAREQRRAVAEANRQANVAVRESQREVAAAMKVAQDEMRKVQPELKKMQAEIARMKPEIVGAAAQSMVLAGLANLSNVEWRNPAPMVQRRTSTFNVTGTPKIIVEAESCDVVFRGTDSPNVRYVLSEFGVASGTEAAGITEDRSGNEIKLRVSGDNIPAFPGSRSSVNRVRLEVFVPRRSDITVKTDGEVRVSNISGSIDIKGEDRAIDVRDSQGKLKIAAEDGRVRVVGFSGEFESDVVEGDVFLEGKFDSVASKAIAGTVTITVADNLNAVVTSTADIKAANTSGKQENSRKIVFGDGVSKYNFDFEDVDEGRVIVRNSNSVIVE